MMPNMYCLTETTSYAAKRPGHENTKTRSEQIIRKKNNHSAHASDNVMSAAEIAETAF